MTLGKQISRLRAAKGLSQEDLANDLQVSRQSISKWETDTSVPELDKLLKLSEVFGVTLDELVKGPAEEAAQAIDARVTAKEIAQRRDFANEHARPLGDAHVHDPPLDGALPMELDDFHGLSDADIAQCFHVCFLPLCEL